MYVTPTGLGADHWRGEVRHREIVTAAGSWAKPSSRMAGVIPFPERAIRNLIVLSPVSRRTRHSSFPLTEELKLKPETSP